MSRYYVAGASFVGLTMVTTAVLWVANPQVASAHCQVPCGIYDDAAWIARLNEDTATIAKAVDQINLLSGKHDAQAFNQASRWIATKEVHASHIIEVVSQYFLTQKVKPVAHGGGEHDAYLHKLADHHAVMVAAMKTKQHADASYVNNLRSAIARLATHYK